MPTAKNTGAQARPAEPESGIEISPRKLLEAALYKAWVTIQQEDKLTKATMDGVVQLLKLQKSLDLRRCKVSRSDGDLPEITSFNILGLEDVVDL